MQGVAERSVLGELQQNNATAAAKRGEGFDSWAARKQLQTKVETLQARAKARLCLRLDPPLCLLPCPALPCRGLPIA